jgi:hypothetical protein
LAIVQISTQEAARSRWIEDIVRELSERSNIGPKRRRYTRYPLRVHATATPLDEQFRPSGSPFPVLARDVSAGGIGLVHSRPLDAKYIMLDFTTPDGRQMHVTIEVLHCNEFLCGSEDAARNALDDMCTYYESDGPFVTNPNDCDADATLGL